MVRALIDELTRDIAKEVRPAGVALPSIRSLARERGCAPGTVARAYEELKRAGLIVARDRAPALVAHGAATQARRRLGGDAAVLRLAGSDDPALDALLRQVQDEVELADGPRGSVLGLEQLARGSARCAAIHLLHSESGRYNDPFVRLLLASERVALVHLWRREVGLVVARGNPRTIRTVGDLDGQRIVWRAPGTGSRLALERLLRAAGVAPHPELGELAESHFGVAATVAADAADAGLAVRAAATACDLDFIALAVEPFELAVRETELDALSVLLDALATRELTRRIGSLGGYDLASAGQIRRAA
jgi:putative molybdopterin biosynthesis protein